MKFFLLLRVKGNIRQKKFKEKKKTDYTNTTKSNNT